MKKNKFLHKPTEPIDVNEKTPGELLREMQHLGFQGRKLGEAVEAWLGMLKEENILIFLGISGAMVPAGMRKVISYLIEQRFVDCVVSTGANLFHDLHEALGKKHYVGSHTADDEELYSCSVDRIYDIFANEKEFERLDNFIGSFAKELDEKKRYSSREFLYLLAKKIEKEAEEKDSILLTAARAGVPVFAPSLADSSIGIGLAVAMKRGKSIMIDTIKDVYEITALTERFKKTGVIYVGGGVPKNFIQQIEIVAKMFNHELEGHEYAVQFTADAPHWGGLSGCTFEEAVSWGKISSHAKKVQVFVDATIALPIVAHALRDRTKKEGKRKKIPDMKRLLKSLDI